MRPRLDLVTPRPCVPLPTNASVPERYEESRLRRLAILAAVGAAGPLSIEQVAEHVLPGLSRESTTDHVQRLVAAGLLTRHRLEGTKHTGPRVVYRRTRRRRPLEVEHSSYGGGPTV